MGDKWQPSSVPVNFLVHISREHEIIPDVMRFENLESKEKKEVSALLEELLCFFRNIFFVVIFHEF